MARLEIIATIALTLGVISLAAFAVDSGWQTRQPQQQPYPGQQQPYPQDQYPIPGTTTRLPGGLPMPPIKFPRRKSKDSTEGAGGEQPRVMMAPVEGRLRRVSAKELLLETGGKKKDVLRFRLLPKSRFVDKGGAPFRDSLLNPGDLLRVNVNPDDVETALLVMLLERGGQNERAAADRPVNDAAIREPREEDFGKAREAAAAEPPPGPAPAGAGEEPRSDAPERSRKTDESDELILDSAKEEALRFSSALPDFLAQQVTSRYFAARDGAAWNTLDVVTAELSYSRGREEYRDIRVDGRPAAKPPESYGAWTTGEFGSTLEDLLSEETNAKFRRRPGLARAAGGRSCWAFDFTVKQATSHWTLVSPDGRKHNAAYRGSMCVDQETRRVIRIEQRTEALPGDFPIARAEAILEYGYARIDTQNHLLPLRGDNVLCLSGGSCSRNALEFRNYRKFAAESTVKF